MHIVPTDIHAIFVHNLCNICAHCTMHWTLFRQIFAPSTVSALILLKIGGNLFGKLIFSCHGHLTILLKQGRFLSKRSNLLLKSVWTKHLAMLSSYQVHPVRGRSRKERNQSKSSRKLPRESIIWGGYSGSKVLHGRQIIFVKYIQKQEYQLFCWGSLTVTLLIQQQQWDLFCRGVKSVRKER